MNQEQILECAEQSRLYAKSVLPNSVDDPIRWTYEYHKKFAELIVKECMTMSDELKAQYLTSRKSTMDFDEKNIYAEGEAACDIIKYKMKKQFGVEE
jgi:hypothetical protein